MQNLARRLRSCCNLPLTPSTPVAGEIEAVGGHRREMYESPHTGANNRRSHLAGSENVAMPGLFEGACQLDFRSGFDSWQLHRKAAETRPFSLQMARSLSSRSAFRDRNFGVGPPYAAACNVMSEISVRLSPSVVPRVVIHTSTLDVLVRSCTVMRLCPG